MVITCPYCKKMHTLDKSRIPDIKKIKNARCRGCGKVFQLSLTLEKEAGKEKKPEPKTMTRAIGVCLSKGGVGKTTTAVNLAAGLALAGHKVLLVDTDTQGQASYLLGATPKATLTELVTGELSADEVLTKVRNNLWLLAGGKSLAGIKRLIERKDFGGELTLKETLLPLEGRYDYVIVDTSPGWDPLTVNVLFYVRELLTPVALEVLSLQGLSDFITNVAAIRKYRKDVNLHYILPTFHDKRIKQTTTILKKMEERYSSRLCTPIRYNVRLSEAPATGKTIYEFAPGSNGAHDYRDLVRKITNNDKLFR